MSTISDTLNKPLFLSVSLGHFIGLVLGGLVALGIMVIMGQNILGWVMAALVAFLIIHLFHAQPKQKLVMVAIASVVIIVVGGALIGPNTMNAMKNGHIADNDNFKNIDMEYSDGSLTVSFDGTPPEGEGIVPAIAFQKINMIIFGGVYSDTRTFNYQEVSGGSITLSNWNTNDLHYIILAYCVKNTDGSLSVIAKSAIAFTDGKVFTGNQSSICWSGAAYGTAFFAAVFVILTLAGWFFRSRMQKTRTKMENEGRLYPQGYGRCAKCNAIILPGEVECRKCGAYIDRPDDMRQKKVDYFRCTNCGQEVLADAEACPKCGAVFSEEETKIVHSDGTSQDAFECPDCGTMVPVGEGFSICPRCGKRFQK